MVRHYGEDSPFSAWLRENKDKIPSNGIETGTTFNDVDFVINCWKRRHTGEQIKSVTQVEIKTRCGDVSFQQMKAFSALSAFAGCKNFVGCQYRFYGHCFLLMSGTRPDNSERIVWKRFNVLRMKKDENGRYIIPELLSHDITESQFIDICTSELHPITLRKFNPGRSHHGGRTIVSTEIAPLGFEFERIVHKKW